MAGAQWYVARFIRGPVVDGPGFKPTPTMIFITWVGTD